MKLKPLPEFIQFNDYGLMVGIAAILHKQYGFTIAENIKGVAPDGQNKVCVMIIRGDLIAYKGNNPNEGSVVTSTADFLARYTEQPLKVGAYEVKDITETGFKVGCTSVPWETFDAISKLRPVVGKADEFDPVAFLSRWKVVTEGVSIMGDICWDYGKFRAIGLSGTGAITYAALFRRIDNQPATEQDLADFNRFTLFPKGAPATKGDYWFHLNGDFGTYQPVRGLAGDTGYITLRLKTKQD